MPLQVLLLLILWGPGSSLQLWDTWEGGAKGALGRQLDRGRRQVDSWNEDFDAYDAPYNTDPPEMLENDGTEAATLSPDLQAVTGLSRQRDSAGPGTPEPATLEVARGVSAGLDAGGAAIGDLSTELVTAGIPSTLVSLPKELVTSIPPITEAPPTRVAPSTELASMKALSVGPAATEALTPQSMALETLTTQPEATEAPSTVLAATEAPSTTLAATEAPSTTLAATEAPSTTLAATEAPSTVLAATEALTTQPAATEALTTQPAATEALTTQPATTEAPSTEPAATEALPKDPATTKAPSTQPTTTWDLTTARLVPSDPPWGTTVAVSSSSDSFIKQQKNSQALSPQSSVSSSPAGGLDYIPVKHCLLAILVLALVATTFLVCTVVLAVRLSRKNHMYPVRNYSPTEMVCISALLPEGEEGSSVTANGRLPATKKAGLKEGSGDDREGDDLTLHSFLP